MRLISASTARKIIGYDKEDGAFIWRVTLSNRAPSGSVAGVIAKNGYRYITIDGTPFLAHRLAWLIVTGMWPLAQIDHINGIRSDNRWSNLREATCSQNAQNGCLRSTNTSGFKGVSWAKDKERWVARITIDRKVRVLGYFREKEQAHEAYQAAALRLHGEFART